MAEGGLKREYVHAPLHSVCGMAVPQLVWVNVKTGGSSPLSANISNRLSSEMSLATGARKYIAVSFAAAKRLKKLERVTGHSNSPCFGSFAKEVNLTAIGENFDVLPFDNCDLRNSATQEIRTPDKGVITNGVDRDEQPWRSSPSTAPSVHRSVAWCSCQRGEVHVVALDYAAPL